MKETYLEDKPILFKHTSTTWHRHYNLNNELCNSRIMLLFYKWHHFETTEWYICLDCNQIGKRDKEDS